MSNEVKVWRVAEDAKRDRNPGVLVRLPGHRRLYWRTDGRRSWFLNARGRPDPHDVELHGDEAYPYILSLTEWLRREGEA